MKDLIELFGRPHPSSRYEPPDPRGFTLSRYRSSREKDLIELFGRPHPSSRYEPPDPRGSR